MKNILYTLLIVLLAVMNMQAQEEIDFIEDAKKQLETPMNGVNGGPNGAGNGVVGAIGGTVSVGGLGAANYSIPIEVPQGIGSVLPGISIVYNSQSGNGLLGWGWNLAGTSAIIRTGADLYHDGFIKGVDFGYNLEKPESFDRFSLDGQRLILVEGAYYGANNSQYRTEVDGMNKVVAYTESGIRGAAKFKVWTAEGLIMEYGYNNNARMIHNCQDNTSLKEVGAWLLNRVEDRNGNYMIYQYDVTDNQYYLAKIYYSGNANAEDGDRGLACCSVNFIFQDRMDSDITFIGNHALKQNKLLKTIEIRWWENHVSQYDFSYYDIDVSNGYFFYRLKDITYSSNGVSFNPTIIDWGDNDYGQPTSIMMIGIDDAIKNCDKVAGDFNGDGMSDFIAIEEIVTQNFWGANQYKYVGHIYYNNGIVIENNQRRVKFCFQYCLELGKTKPELYTADLDGDGRDDMISVERKRKSLYYTKIDYYVIKPYLNCYENSTNSWKLYASYRDWEDEDIRISGELAAQPLMIGDFLGRGKNEIVMQIPEGDYVENNLLYITYLGNCRFHMQKTHRDREGLLPGKQRYAADFDGDGLLEVYCRSYWYSAPSHIYKLTSESTVQHIVNNNPLTNKNLVNIGDFNGDGKADVLTINRETNKWELYLFKQNSFYRAFEVDSGLPLLPFNHENISVQDFNGDGKADVFYKNPNGGVDVFFSPLIFDETNSKVSFAIEQHYSNSIGSAALVAGNFLGQENPALLRKNYIFSLNPISNRYNVKSISDGMGNTIEFKYDYLSAIGSSIYSWSKANDRRDLDIYSVSINIKAVKEIVASNTFSELPTTSTRYHYSNALAHRTGHGILGFLNMATASYINDIRQDSVVTNNSLIPIKAHRTLSLIKMVTYNKFNRIVLEECYSNNYIENHSNPLVYIPVVTKIQTSAFNPDTGGGILLSKSITENRYRIDASSQSTEGLGYYNNTLKLTDTYTGITDNIATSTVSYCPYVTHTQTIFQPDNYLDNWIINRPTSTMVSAWKDNDNQISKSLIVYQYRDNYSYLPEIVTSYPGGDISNANGLATATSYQYDLAGNVIQETLTAVDGSLQPRTTSYTYQRYRFPDSETNTIGYTSTSNFDSRYGEMKWSKDCNNQVTYFNYSDHLGSSSWVKYPDHTYGCTALRWAYVDGDLVADAPETAAYYSWKRISGESPTKVFYDAAGRELRTVSVGLYGTVIYQDTKYNNMGLVSQKSLPYFKDETPVWTSYQYDGLLRPTYTYMPDGTYTSTKYDGLTVIAQFHDTHGNVRETSQTSNYLGQVVNSVDAMGTEVNYHYYHDGKLKWTQIGNNEATRINLEYDEAGNRTLLHDPNYGRIVEIYDAFGQLRSTTSPKGDMTEYHYDNLGRMNWRKETDNNAACDVHTTWKYHEEAGKKGLLKEVQYGNDQAISYCYDGAHLNRLSSKTETINGESYNTIYTYDDNFGFPLRVKTVTYPTGYTVKNEYENGSGILYRINDNNDQLLWEALFTNAMGQITEYHLGNGIDTNREYDPLNGRLNSIQSHTNQQILQDLGYEYDDFGNLAARTDRKSNLREEFKYDELDRLDTIHLNGSQTGAMAYDSYGRMTDKKVDGHQVFTSAQYNYCGPDGQLRPHAISSATMEGNPFPSARLDVTYTMFDKVKTISQNDRQIEYSYGYNHQRISMTDACSNNTNERKIYVGNCEFIEEFSSSSLITRTFIPGPMGVFAVFETNNPMDGDDITEKRGLHYIHKDHLGSWTTITDAEGNVEQEQSFDAWGNSRNPETWTGSSSSRPMFDRGFTGHEHLYGFDLINMNGRMYDPLMSSFLSVDNYVQSPENSQNFNRYAYCLNNPLKYTDPSGEVFGIDDAVIAAIAIGAAINVTMNGINNVKNGERFFLGAGKAAVMGGLQGFVSFGIGECAGAMDVIFKNNPLTAKLTKVGFQMVAHGTLGGVSTQSRGGTFWQGFVSSASASLISSVVGLSCEHFKINAVWTTTATIAAGGLSGGITSTMAGGDFWDGVCNGLISAGLNHALHGIIRLPVRQRTKQYRVNKVGRLPLDSDTKGLTYGAVQTANYKMLYNVTVADVPLYDSDGNYIGSHRVLTVSATSYNTIVEGDVQASAKASIIVNGTLTASNALQMEPGETLPIMQEGSTYVGSTSFSIPNSENVSLQMEGGWTVNMGTGNCIPTLMGKPINADLLISISHKVK